MRDHFPLRQLDLSALSDDTLDTVSFQQHRRPRPQPHADAGRARQERQMRRAAKHDFSTFADMAEGDCED